MLLTGAQTSLLMLLEPSEVGGMPVLPADSLVIVVIMCIFLREMSFEEARNF
jgi:hypothetical protein